MFEDTQISMNGILKNGLLNLKRFKILFAFWL